MTGPVAALCGHLADRRRIDGWPRRARPGIIGGPAFPSPPPVSDPDPKPLPPEPPLPSDCCDSGCAVCVHDTYTEELQYYREQLAAWRARHPDADAGA